MELTLPMNYVELEQEEMMYLDGGKRYSGAQGWTAAALLGVAGGILGSFGKMMKKTLISAIGTIISGGPLAWLAGALAGFGTIIVSYAATCFLSAASSASWLMATRGYYDINRTWQWANPIGVS